MNRRPTRAYWHPSASFARGESSWFLTVSKITIGRKTHGYQRSVLPAISALPAESSSWRCLRDRQWQSAVRADACCFRTFRIHTTRKERGELKNNITNSTQFNPVLPPGELRNYLCTGSCVPRRGLGLLLLSAELTTHPFCEQ